MFKDSFKYYKSKNPPPDLGRVLDFDKMLDSTHCKVKKIENLEAVGSYFGLKAVELWDIYEIVDRPGLLFIKNPFTILGQRYWTVRCLRDYSRKPNKSNIDTANILPDNKEWWDVCQNNNVLLLNKLRWITLGYHHNWDTKVYSENSKSTFPKDLKDMTAYLANALGYNDFSAEAAIVNFYHMDSNLSGHTDHSEQNLEAPLFSFSFGQTAIFLIGGYTKEDFAVPIFLRSGDIIVMSKESRLCYHGVPKILQVDYRFWGLLNEETDKNVSKEYKEIVNVCEDEGLWKPFSDYLSHSRININVRQVLNNGECVLKS